MTVIKSIAVAAFAALFATTASAATIYKDPRCGCCTAYGEYVREMGYDIVVEDSFDVVSMSVEAGIPADLQGCHLMMIEGYAVSGHVPAEAIERLLAEKPDIDGITLPGMPMGSPGMGGTQDAPFEIKAVSGEGNTVSVFMRL
ncbi:DUF411 domain-containing protein [Pelagibacterium halotolerans]|uniref:DUF411 domain-containing protein n=1 Tax=Pelagibacterium halotolerans TaxID=531813 RepID=UPI00384B72F8